MREQKGFTLIELMVVVLIIGVLAAIAIPMYLESVRRVKAAEAPLSLNRIGKSAMAYFQANGSYPQGTAAALPGPDGDACKGSGGRFPIETTMWQSDPVWSELEVNFNEPNYYTFHYASASKSSAESDAVGDTDCDGDLATFRLLLTAVNGEPASTLISPPRGEH